MNVLGWLLDEPPVERASGGPTADRSRGPAAAGALAAGGLLGAAAFHAVWVVSPWPLGSWAEFAELVVGVPEAELPSAPATAAVAVLLSAAAWLVVTAARPGRRLAASRLVRWGAWTVTGILALRGLGGLLAPALALGTAPDGFRRWDLLLYSPLCTALAALTAFVLLRTRPVGTPDGAGDEGPSGGSARA
ncbi:DUF3995 domain-containing protein [Kitasatospora sp. NPDC048365]|uniref:DUF3995 domain-containing protein n=1 Tax=Kitasatospora sp. NPDC048365 TaxID=3364050 RepID=UPI00371DCF57